MKTIFGQTKTAKGLTYLNLASILAMIVFLVLLPILNLFAPVISSRLIYIFSIIFIVFNIGFFVVPQHLKLVIFKRRMLAVYLPTLVVLCFAVWNLIYVIINLKVTEIFVLFFSLMTCLQPITFSLLVSKLVSD